MTECSPFHSGILALPYQLLIDGILGKLDVQSLVQVRATCRTLRLAVDDDIIWRRRILADFRFPVRSTARTSGWRTLYRALADPEMFTWGNLEENRLGVDFAQLFSTQRHEAFCNVMTPVLNIVKRFRMMPFPLKIRWRDPDLYDGKAQVVSANGMFAERRTAFDDDDDEHDGNGAQGGNASVGRIEPQGRKHTSHTPEVGVPIELHAGGWSFFSLTHQGQILAWGSSTGSPCESTSTEATFKAPTLLDTDGQSAESLSVGREHLIARMSNGTIYEWSRRWDRPAVHYPDSLLTDLAGSQPGEIRQIVAGWNFNAVLVDYAPPDNSDVDRVQSQIIVWQTEWTYNLERQAWYKRARTVTPEAVGPAWSVAVPTVLLPAIPKRVKHIAAGDNFILALTEEGSVFHLALPQSRGPNNGTVAQYVRGAAYALRRELDRTNASWVLLTAFCGDIEANGWDDNHTSNVWHRPQLQHLLKHPVPVTHISAQFRSFAIYAPDAGKVRSDDQTRDQSAGNGIVLLGNSDKPYAPIIVPELQGANVVKVTHGDWHSGALTQDGRVLTWGSQSDGALGTWDDLEVTEGSQSVLSGDESSVSTGAGRGPRIGLGGRMTGAFNNVLRMRQQAAAAIDTPSEDSEQRAREEDQVAHMVDAERRRFLLRRLPEKVCEPRTVRFGFPRIGEQRNGHVVSKVDDEETKFVFDIAFAGWHSGALAVDRKLL